MSKQSVTVKLALPYMLRKDDLDNLERQRVTPETFCRRMSEAFIGRALTAMHGQELDRKTARAFRPIKRELDKGEDTITLDGTAWAWFAELFFSAKSEDQVKVQPAETDWWFQWLEALEDVRAAVKAEASE